MGIIIAAMFTAFWIQYEADRQQELQDKKEFEKILQKHDAQLRNLTRCVITDPDTREDSKDELKDFLKLETRGTTLN